MFNILVFFITFCFCILPIGTMGQQKAQESLLDSYANAVVAELMFLQRDLPWGAGYNAVAKSIPTPLEQAAPGSFLTGKTLPPFKLPIQEGFKIIDGKLQVAAIIILYACTVDT